MNSTVNLLLKRLGIILLVVIAMSGSYYLGSSAHPSDDTFSEVFNKLYDDHYTQPSKDDLWQGAIDGMINSLDDPFTNYFDQESYEAFRQSQEESFVGIGVTVENVDEAVIIRSVFPSSPAEEAGLMAGDQITHVDDVDYRGRPFIEATSVLRGEAGSEVVIGYKRPGVETTLYVALTREDIANPTVTAELVDDNIGVIYLHAFGTDTVNIFTSYIDAFENDDNIEGLIIDLRNNGGGDLNTLIDLLDIFLDKDAKSLPYFTLQTYDNRSMDIYDENGSNTDTKAYPISLIVNGQSASASEVFAAAMHQYGDYPVYGETTYGKGTLQQSIPLRSALGDHLHLTVGRWLTPEGDWVHYQGDTPGFEPSHPVTQSEYFTTPMLFLQEDETYSFDMVDDTIAIAQTILNALGYTVRNDGYFNLATQDALTLYQSQNGIAATGTLNDVTAAQLSEDLYTYRNALDNDLQFQAAYQAMVALLDE
ncbi:MAG: S41 family peptidase [Bacillota bacterium]